MGSSQSWGYTYHTNGSCYADGGDYDCTFYTCTSSATFTATSSSVSVDVRMQGHSWDCDCDTSTWVCSQENTVAGRTAVSMAARFTILPPVAGTNLYDIQSMEEVQCQVGTHRASYTHAWTHAPTHARIYTNTHAGTHSCWHAHRHARERVHA